MGIKQTQTVTFNEMPFQVYTYRPDGEIKGVLLAFHGNERDAVGIRDAAVSIADKMGYFVVSPLFDSNQFDSSEYQQGGILANGQLVADRDDWTVARAKDFAEWGAAKAGLDATDEVILFGHSGGGQFMSRVAAYGDDSGFDKMIIANPSTHVWPSMAEKVTYGFGGGYFSQAESEALLKDYLADPITIYLGSEDNNPNDPDLSTSAAAGVSHTFGGMLRSPAMVDAIDTDTPSTPAPGPTPEPTPEPHTYVFNTLSEAANAATITDYRDGDVFDFNRLDADVRQSGNQDFHWIGQQPFSRNGEELKFVQDVELGVTWIEGSVDHDSSAEFRIKVEGLHTFTAADFVL
jgi:pimeloyl-ACP methyl ester carboxylesterase